MALTPGTKINDRYELTSFIASGGMGEVWKAQDLRLDRTVAIKTVEAKYVLTEPKAMAILHDEAKAGAQLLGHANIVGILDIIDHDAGPGITGVIVMEYVDGIPLSKWISDVVPKLDPKLAYRLNARLGWEFTRAIEAASRRGLLHRDIKPHNAIISSRGTLKVTDFGLARFIDAVTRTHTVSRSFSAAFAAPEQWSDEKYTDKTDIYQLGCALYQLFTGVLPFDRGSLMALMTAHLNSAPKPPVEINPQISEDLSNMLMRALKKAPDERPDFWEINDALAEVLFVGPYCLTVHFKGLSKKLKSAIEDITNLSGASDDTVNFNYPDLHEVLGEAVGLAQLGAPFTLVPVEQTAPSAMSGAEPPQFEPSKPAAPARSPAAPGKPPPASKPEPAKT